MFSPLYMVEYVLLFYVIPWALLVAIALFILRGKFRSIALGGLSLPAWLAVFRSVWVFWGWDEFQKTWWFTLPVLIIALFVSTMSVFLWPRAGPRKTTTA